MKKELKNVKIDDLIFCMNDGKWQRVLAVLDKGKEPVYLLSLPAFFPNAKELQISCGWYTKTELDEIGYKSREKSDITCTDEERQEVTFSKAETAAHDFFQSLPSVEHFADVARKLSNAASNFEGHNNAVKHGECKKIIEQARNDAWARFRKAVEADEHIAFYTKNGFIESPKQREETMSGVKRRTMREIKRLIVSGELGGDKFVSVPPTATWGDGYVYAINAVCNMLAKKISQEENSNK